jgi:hypothetical protein
VQGASAQATQLCPAGPPSYSHTSWTASHAGQSTGRGGLTAGGGGVFDWGWQGHHTAGKVGKRDVRTSNNLLHHCLTLWIASGAAVVEQVGMREPAGAGKTGRPRRTSSEWGLQARHMSGKGKRGGRGWWTPDKFPHREAGRLPAVSPGGLPVTREDRMWVCPGSGGGGTERVGRGRGTALRA